MQVCHCTVWKLQQWSRIHRRVRGRPPRQPELVCCSRTGGTVGLLCLTSPIMPSWQLQEGWTSQVRHLKEHACDGICMKHVAVAVSSGLIRTHAKINDSCQASLLLQQCLRVTKVPLPLAMSSNADDQIVKRMHVCFAVIKMNWTGQSVESWRELLDGSQGGAAGVGAVLHRQGLPKRLADALCHEANVTGTPLAQLKKVIAVKIWVLQSCLC